MSGTAQRFDVHQKITDRIVAAIETAGEFKLPWTRCSSRPINVASGNACNGVNVLSLWIAAVDKGYPSNVWGTYRHWQAAGCQVRKGEKSSLVVFYRKIEAEDEKEDRLIARASRVFNAAQVDGYQAPVQPVPFDPIPRAEALAAATGARIEEGGDRACYMPTRDLICMPDRGRFVDREAFYAVLCHELVHWTGVAQRLGRDLTGRFGDAAYALEEQVAELGAAFLCADLGLTPEPRDDHACYVKSWLAVLKGDKRAIFTAASKTSQAAGWLMGLEARVGRKAAA